MFNAVNYIDKTIDEMWKKFKGAQVTKEEAQRLKERLIEFSFNVMTASLSDPAWDKKE